ncbi:secretin N-terminal domain-containing protein [Alkalimarinus coralli]|nr:secretin N-terminal domain-containing protein [Alkalimarinus coralli]
MQSKSAVSSGESPESDRFKGRVLMGLAAKQGNCSVALLRGAAIILLSVLAASCTLIPQEEFLPPPPLRAEPIGVAAQKTTQHESVEPTDQEKDEKRKVKHRFERPPVSADRQVRTQLLEDDPLFPVDEPANINMSFGDLPLPVFINEVFANQLSLDFEMAQDVANKQDLVTLRITEPRNRQDIFNLSRQILANYGVLIVRQGDVLRFVLGTAPGISSEPPLIVTGTALPSVPSTHRPIFLIRSLKVISNSDAYSMLKTVFEKQSLKVARDNSRNAVTLQGAPDIVKRAAAVLDLIDKPKMKGRHSLRIEPMYTDAETLSKGLVSAMEPQGYDIGNTSKNTTLVPINELNALFVFAPNEEILSIVRQWVEQLDRVVQKPNQKDGFYWYKVKNTGAIQLSETLNAIMGNSSGRTGERASQGKGEASSKKTTTSSIAVAASSRKSGSFVVDQARNMLLFRGEAAQWQEILPLIHDLDKAPAQVMVEVVVADVTLSETFKFGVEWSVDGALGSVSSLFGDGGAGAGIGGTGLKWAYLSSSGATRIALNAFASDNNVSILQTPKVLVRSGETASVNVGEKIPVLTSRTAEDEIIDGDSAVSQQIEYRDVGIKLTVTPTVFSGGRIDMEVSQDVSASTGDASTPSLTPIITTRNIETNLSLHDGGSVLLGGLITKNQSKGNSRVPILGDIPWIGQLFRTDSTQAGSTELMILIVPYLIEEPGQAEALTRSFREQLQLHPENI